jgi:hypothetical protein
MYIGTQALWNMFFDYASYTSAFSWICFFGFKDIKDTIAKLNSRRQNPVEGETINHQYGDQLNILQRSYKEVPWWWSFILFLITFVIIMTILGTGNLFIPLWTYFIAIGTGAMIVIPLGWLYAVSNFQLPIGIVNELFYGLMVNSVSGHKNPAGASIYSAIAGDAVSTFSVLNYPRNKITGRLEPHLRYDAQVLQLRCLQTIFIFFS